MRYFVLLSFEVKEVNKSLTLAIFRDRGYYGNVSLFLYAQNLEAQHGLDFNLTSRVRNNMTILFTVSQIGSLASEIK